MSDDDELTRRLRALAAPPVDDAFWDGVQQRAQQALAAAPVQTRWRVVRARVTTALVVAAVGVYLVWVDRALAALLR